MQLKVSRIVLTTLFSASGFAFAQAPTPSDSTGSPPAAEAPRKSATEELLVTGTRVRRKDLNTPAPVTVLSRDQISASGKISLGEFLQALPEQGNSGANAQVNNGNDGSIYVSLRSLGAQRTLVLVNGRRMVFGGTGANSAADLATIPTAAIERIEVLKDGASAIYGSDAVAGVVNVILRKRYHGTEVGGYAGTSQHGDGTVYDAHAVTGTAGENGSMLFSVGYQEQKPVFAGDREFSKATYDWNFDANTWANAQTGDPTSNKALAADGNSSTWPHGRFTIPASACANSGAVISHPALASVCAQSNNAGGGFMQDPAQPGAGVYLPFDGNAYNTNPTNYLITPSRRVQLFSTGDLNLGREARAFFEASYVNRSSAQSLAPMPLVNSTIPTAPVTVSKDSIYNPFGVDITSWRKRMVEFGERLSRQDLDTFRVVTGVDGSLGEWAGPLSGWSWDVDFNHGRTAGNQLQTGQLRMPNVANATGPSMRDPATGQPICVRVPGDAASVINGCVPLDVFHGSYAGINAARSYLTYDGADFGTNQQDIYSANFSGDLFRLAADRPAGLALGVDYRRESASFQNNPINSGESSGNNALSTYGGYSVKEAYAELVMPLLSGIPGVEDLEVQAAGRVNSFTTFGTNSTYKLGGRWKPVRDLTVRATWGTAFRAPNVAELYGGAADSYPLVRDPCRRPADGSELQSRCVATGVPAGGSRDSSSQLLEKIVASSDLGPETATTFTFGAVIQPQAVRNFSVTADYYNLNLTRTITTRGAAFILDQCYRAPVMDKASCDLIVRSNAGQVIEINDPRANLGNFHTTGIDLAVRYAVPTEDLGRFSLIVDGTWLNSYRLTNPVGQVTSGVGNYDLGVLPRLKANAGVFWTRGDFGAGVSGRYVGNYHECFDSGNGSCRNDDTQQRQVAHYLPIDVFASYTLRDWAAGSTAVVVGVTNLNDVQPPYLSTALAANSDPSSYDYVGRFVYTRLTHTF